MRFSIVIPSFNQANFISETIESVLSQEGDFELEVFVEDGLSTDGTVEILKRFAQACSKPGRVSFHWVSEKDGGQAHAINKGLAKASGEIVAFLNSDDLYLPGTLARVTKAFQESPDSLWLCGQCMIIDDKGREMHSLISSYKNFFLRHYSYFWLLTENFICQPSVFLRHEALARYGPFSEREYYTMDYEYWLRIGKDNDPIVLNAPLSLFRRTVNTKSNSGYIRQFEDDKRLGLRYARLSGHPLAIPLKHLSALKIVAIYKLLYGRGEVRERGKSGLTTG